MREFFDNVAEEALDAVTTPAEAVSQTVSEAAEILDPSNVKDFAQRKVLEVLKDLQDKVPVFKEAGFELVNYEVELSLTPKLITRFAITKQIDERSREHILAGVKKRPAMKKLLKALFNAAALQKHTAIGDTRLLGLEVHAGAMPKVRLVFGKEGLYRKL